MTVHLLSLTKAKKCLINLEVSLDCFSFKTIAMLTSLCYSQRENCTFKEWFVLGKNKLIFTLIAFCKCRCDCGIVILLTEISAIYTVKFINDRSLQKNVQLKYYTVDPNNSNLQEKSKTLLRVFENKCKWEWRANYSK